MSALSLSLSVPLLASKTNPGLHNQSALPFQGVRRAPRRPATLKDLRFPGAGIPQALGIGREDNWRQRREAGTTRAGGANASSLRGEIPPDTRQSVMSSPPQRNGICLPTELVNETAAAAPALGGPAGPSNCAPAPSQAASGVAATSDYLSDLEDDETLVQRELAAQGGTDWLWMSLHALCWVLMFFPPDPLLPATVPHTLPENDAATAAGAVLLCASLAAGLPAFLTLGRSFTPFPRPREHARLRTGGMYSLVRHPMYGAHVLLFLSLALLTLSPLRLLTAPLLAVVLAGKARTEESHLVERYGEEYRKYMRSVKYRMLPYVL